MSTTSVFTYYYGSECTGSPTHIDFSAVVCSETTECEPSKSDNYASKCYNDTLNADGRLELAQEKFGDYPVLLIDRYSDSGCKTSESSSAYIADGQCYNFYVNGSLTANISEDGATYRSFDKNRSCRGIPSYIETVDGETLQEHSCAESNDGSIRAYTAATSSSSSDSTDPSTSSSGSIDQPTSPSSSTGLIISSSGSTELSTDQSNSQSSSASPAGSPTSALSSHTSTGAIIGTIAAIVFGVAVAVGVGIWYFRAQRKKKQAKLELIESQGYHLWEDETIVTTRIPREKVILETLLSSGGYGEVYRGSFDGQPVAVKMLPQHSRRNLQLVNAFLAEAKLMASLDHPHVVHFVGVAWNSLTDLCVVSELVDNGDLRALLDNYDLSHHPTGFNHTKIKIALHVAHALTYLHSLQPMVLHRDLKSRNILVTHEMVAKLTDFGVSRERCDATMTAGVGTSLWMAPEVLLGHRYDEKADVFSFGVVLSELDSHVLPYAHVKSSQSGNKLSDTAILQMVSLGSLRVQFSENAMPHLKDLGQACVSMDPAVRPSAAEILYRLQLCLKAC
jgi:serine/threonine-protein kinase TNNI3K